LKKINSVVIYEVKRMSLMRRLVYDEGDDDYDYKKM